MGDHKIQISAEPESGTRRKRKAARLALLTAAELSLFGVIAGSFWLQDLRYSLPAPKPAGWVAPEFGAETRLASMTCALPPAGRPVLFNFYSCECPCSRFNLEHLRKLELAYGSRVQFVMVFEGGTESQERDAARGLNIEAATDCDPLGKLARDLGVYATPQAVLLDSQRRLVYRGNYNLGRFCTDPRTDFVGMALQSVVTGIPLPSQLKRAGPAYGCAIEAVSDGSAKS